MKAYNKLLGPLIGSIVPVLAAAGLLPKDMNTPEIIGALTTIVTFVATYFAPANKA